MFRVGPDPVMTLALSEPRNRLVSTCHPRYSLAPPTR